MHYHLERIQIMSKNIPGNNKHLTLSDRSYIETSICKGIKFIEIAKYLCKDPSTISKEVLKHRIKETSSYKSWQSNKCKLRFNCNKNNLCLKCYKTKYQRDVKCHACDKCNSICKDFILDYCNRTSKAPYVCNGCNNIRTCKFDHYYYKALTSQSEYRTSLVENRNGISIDEDTLKVIDAKVSPLIRQGHSPYQVLSENRDINLSVKTIYNYIDNNILSVKNLDLPKKVRYKVRKTHNEKVNNQAIGQEHKTLYREYARSNIRQKQVRKPTSTNRPTQSQTKGMGELLQICVLQGYIQQDRPHTREPTHEMGLPKTPKEIKKLDKPQILRQ